jgi:type IV secretion system protein VirB4
LDVRDGVIISHSYTPANSEKIVERVKRRLGQMQASDDLAASIADQLLDAADAVESGRLGFGDHQMTVTLFAPTIEALEQKVAEVRGVAQQAGVQLVRDRVGLETTFFASHPGNMDYRCRAMMVSSITFADCAALHTVELGTLSQDLPLRTPVTVFETVASTAHRFSFHPPGNPEAEPPNGHTLILGPSSGGKTTTTLFLAAQFLRAGGRVLALAKDRAMQMPITAMGGQYANIIAGHATGLSPLLTERGERGEAWLMGWLSALLETTGPQLTPRQSQALKSAVRQNATAPEDLRSFAHFKDLIGDVEDDRNLSMRIAEWAPSGRYGWAFGKAAHPVVDFSKNDITGVDLTEVLKLGTERTAILGYLFRAIELLMEDRRPTLLIVDEAWQVLNDAYFAKEMSEWLVTARKKNVVVLMLTQFPSQIRESKSRTILEGLPNQLLFPNRKAEAGDYAGFAFTDSELSFVLSGGTLESRLALWRGHQNSTILNVDLSPLGDLLTALGGGAAGLRRFGADYAQTPNFWRTEL